MARQMSRASPFVWRRGEGREGDFAAAQGEVRYVVGTVGTRLLEPCGEVFEGRRFRHNSDNRHLHSAEGDFAAALLRAQAAPASETHDTPPG
jgi:hypothetical protein